MTTRRTLLAVVALTVLCATVALAQYAGPKLEGTATLRSGETISGVILSAQVGMVDGAEIGSKLAEGGHLKIAAEGGDRKVKGIEIASLDVEWVNTGTPDVAKWTIAKFTVVTTSGETIIGEPTWMIHITALIIEQADGTRKTVYAFQPARDNFSPDNLLTKLVIGASAPVADVVPVTPTPAPPVTDTPTTTEVVVIEPVTPPTPDTPVVTPVVTPTVDTPVITVTPDTPTVTVVAPPVVTGMPAASIFAAGEPAVIIFEVINPETGNPMKIKFLLVPLPAE